MIKIYAICTKKAHEEMLHCFHPQYGSHYVDLPDGRILVCATFDGAGGEYGESAFTAHPEVEMLPDPHFQGSEALSVEHQAAIAHLKPEGNTVLHMARAAAKTHPLMKLRSWL